MRCRTLTVALLIVAAWGSPANALGLSPDQMRLLEGGAVVVLDILPPGGPPARSQGGTAVAFVNASAETVWRVLVDYAGHSGLYPRVKEVRVLTSDAESTLVRYVVGVGPFRFGFYVNNHADAARGRLEWTLDRQRPNDLFQESWGYWQLDQRAHSVMLTYAMAARTVLPALVTRGAERNGLIETVKAVRQRAEHGR